MCLYSNLHLAELLPNCHTVLAKNFKVWHQIKFWEAIVSFPLNLAYFPLKWLTDILLDSNTKSKQQLEN